MVPRKKATVTLAHSLSLPPWKNLTLKERIREVALYAHRNRGRTINLNLSTQFEEYVRTHREPMQAVRKRVHRELSKVDLAHLPMLLVLETTDGTARPHLHGVFIPGGADVELVKHALRRAVGYIEGHAGSTQIKSVLIDPPIGWASYISKKFRRTLKELLVDREEGLVWTSHSLTGPTRDHYESIRLGQVKAANLTSRPTSAAV
jgi:hypothetical protein